MALPITITFNPFNGYNIADLLNAGELLIWNGPLLQHILTDGFYITFRGLTFVFSENGWTFDAESSALTSSMSQGSALDAVTTFTIDEDPSAKDWLEHLIDFGELRVYIAQVEIRDLDVEDVRLVFFGHTISVEEEDGRRFLYVH